MTREQAVFRAVVWYEAVALVSRGKIPPWTHFLMKLSPRGRVVASFLTGVWMLRHLDVLPQWLRRLGGRLLEGRLFGDRRVLP